MSQSYLIHTTWRHGPVVKSQEWLYNLLTPCPVSLTSEVNGVVVPADCVRQVHRKTRVQVRFVLAESCLRGQKPGHKGTGFSHVDEEDTLNDGRGLWVTVNREWECVCVRTFTCSWWVSHLRAGPRISAWPCFLRSPERWSHKRGTRVACGQRRSPDWTRRGHSLLPPPGNTQQGVTLTFIKKTNMQTRPLHQEPTARRETAWERLQSQKMVHVK